MFRLKGNCSILKCLLYVALCFAAVFVESCKAVSERRTSLCSQAVLREVCCLTRRRAQMACLHFLPLLRAVMTSAFGEAW
jgi:hypothetical protein